MKTIKYSSVISIQSIRAKHTPKLHIRSSGTHSKSKRKYLALRNGRIPITRKIGIHKYLETLRAKVEQRLAVAILLFFRETVF